MFSAKISSKNQITLPSDICKALALKSGDRLLLDVEEGSVILKPLGSTSVDDLAGCLRRYARTQRLPWKVIRERVKKEVARAATQKGQGR